MSGHRNFNELLAKMSPERRARVKVEADDLHREYVLSQIIGSLNMPSDFKFDQSAGENGNFD